jgi:hypothetical protein
MCRQGYDTEKTQAPGSGNPRDLRELRDVCEKSALNAQGPVGDSIARDPFDELFRYHPPTPQDLPKFQAVNQAAKNFAEVLRANCPRCEDFINAMERIREARMWANSAIALQGRI